MAKLSKKEWGYIGGVTLVALIILWLLYRKGQTTEILNGAGQKPDTGYLTMNIPPLNQDGLTLPHLGNVYVPPMNLNLGGCNQCYQPPYYSSPTELAAALADQQNPSFSDALKALPNYMEVHIDQAYTAGAIDEVNRRVGQNIGALLLPTTNSIMKDPAPLTTGPSGTLSAGDLFAFAQQTGTFGA